MDEEPDPYAPVEWDGTDPGCGHPFIAALCIEGRCGGWPKEDEG